MSEYCNPMKCPAYASGWCEYDAIEDKFYPMEPHICPLLKEEEEWKS